MNGNKLPYRGWQTSIPVYVDGTFGIEVENGVYRYQGTQTVYAFENTNNELTGLINTNLNERTLVTENMVDFTNYSYVKVTDGSTGEVSMDVRNLNTTGYLWVMFMQNSVGDRSIRFGISTTKQTFGDSVITISGTKYESVNFISSQYAHISSIIVE